MPWSCFISYYIGNKFTLSKYKENKLDVIMIPYFFPLECVVQVTNIFPPQFT